MKEYEMGRKSKHAIGEHGERRAMDILRSSGFTNIQPQEPFGTYDIVARKDGRRYGINVKYSPSRRSHSLTVNNLSKMVDDYNCKERKLIPAFLFLSEQVASLFVLEQTYWNYSDSPEIAVPRQQPNDELAEIDWGDPTPIKIQVFLSSIEGKA